MGHHFIINTDQKALKYLLEQRIIDSKLIEFRFEVYYKPGKENREADALSRSLEPKELKSYSLWKLPNWELWEDEIKQDIKFTSIIQLLATG